MNRYILIPEDTIRVLPPEDGVEAAVEVFCSRTVIFFDISQIQDVCLMHNVLSNRRRVDALCFTAADRLLEREQMVLVPTDRTDYAAFLTDFRTYAPETLDFPRRKITSRNPATTTAIITDKTKKPHILKEKDRRCSMKKRDKKDRPDLVPEIFAQQPSFTDPQGSWTGLPMNEHEIPVQDADDL